MNVIVWDFEVFKFDTLGGFLILGENENTYYQTWDLDEIRNFYEEHRDNSIFIGHNSTYYDDLIMEAIVKGKDPYQKSQEIIKSGIRRKARIQIYSYDMMSVSRNPFSLKLTELICGKTIETSEVDFNLDRHLTEEEKKKTEYYNRCDLDQTLYNFKKMYNQFKLRIQIINYYGLDLAHNLRVTGTQLAANVLGAKNDPSLKLKPIPPTIYPTLRLKNQRLLDFYLNEEFRQGKSDVINVCGADLTIAAGGIHSALTKFYAPKILYGDVSGFYNLIMLNLDLLPRTMKAESKELYEFMYHEQLKLKKFPERADERSMYKTILLSVFGAMNNEYTDFYDPWKALLVTISGQLYLVDLLEKLEGLVTIVQANTDGIMMIPHDWNDEPKVIKIIEEWEARTGFVIKKEHLYNLWQRDVNCYFCQEENGNVIYKGDAVRNYVVDDVQYASCRLFDCKEPPIIAQGIINYLLYNKTPEDTVRESEKNLILFQYACKQKSFDYMTQDKILLIRNKRGTLKEEEVESVVVKSLNRVFAAKTEYIEGLPVITVLTKHKDRNGKHAVSRVANLPDSVFIYNEDIRDAYDILKDKINYQYYVDRIYEKVQDFLPED